MTQYNPDRGAEGRSNLKADLGAAKDRVGQESEEVARVAREGVDAVKKKASEYGEAAAGQLEERGEKIKGRTAHAMGSIARAMRSAREDLDGDGSQFLGGLLESAADGLEDMSERLDRSPAGDIVETVRDFGRRNPAAFIAGSVLAGFAVARLVGSSQPATRAQEPAQPGDTPAATPSRTPDSL